MDIRQLLALPALAIAVCLAAFGQALPAAAKTTTLTIARQGNLREGTGDTTALVGKVCPGDTVEVLEESGRAIVWYRVRVASVAASCDPARALVGAKGWVLKSNTKAAPTKPSTPARRPTAVPQSVAPRLTGQRVGAACRDGTTSRATGRGACSRHGGVDHWLVR